MAVKLPKIGSLGGAPSSENFKLDGDTDGYKLSSCVSDGSPVVAIEPKVGGPPSLFEKKEEGAEDACNVSSSFV